MRAENRDKQIWQTKTETLPLQGVHITFDLDDVLGYYMPGFLNFYNKIHGTRFIPSDLESYSLARHLNEDEKRICELVDEFSETEEYANIPVSSGAYAVLSEMKKQGAKLSVLTSRYDTTAKVTESWTDRNYTGIFDNIEYTNGKNTKGEMAKKMDSDLHIDDAAKNIFSVTKQGIASIVYSATWNENVHFEPGVRRAKSFSEIRKAVREMFGCGYNNTEILKLAAVNEELYEGLK